MSGFSSDESQYGTTPIMGAFGIFKSESILPNFTPAKRDGKRQIWYSNLCFWGLQKFHSDGKRSKVDDIVISVSKKTGSASFSAVNAFAALQHRAVQTLPLIFIICS